MLGYLTLVGWTLNVALGLRMHGVKRMPAGVVFAHASLTLTGYVAWIIYLTAGRPAPVGWGAVVWVILANGFGDAAVVRRWKRKSDGGKGLAATYVERIKRPALLTHATVGGITTVLAFVTVWTA